MMGEIADMMLDGTLCEGCGEFIEGDASGFPRYCSPQCAKDRGVVPEIQKRKKPVDSKRKSTVVKNDNSVLSAKLLKRLQYLSRCGTEDASLTPKAGQSMYAGDIWEGATKQYEDLAKRGFVERRSPHNMAHKDRAVITEKGLEFLRLRGSNG